MARRLELVGMEYASLKHKSESVGMRRVLIHGRLGVWRHRVTEIPPPDGQDYSLSLCYVLSPSFRQACLQCSTKPLFYPQKPATFLYQNCLTI